MLPIMQFVHCRNRSLVCVCAYGEKLTTHTGRMLNSASLQSAAQTDLTQHKVMEEELPVHSDRSALIPCFYKNKLGASSP